MDKSLFSSLERFARANLTMSPTPLQPLARLSAHLGGPRIWIKRDDLTGTGFGGNKIRKLDFLLPEAISQGADTLVSGGVVQSNSQRQVAGAAAKLGFECHLAVYHGRLAPPSPEYETSGNAMLNRIFGAHLHDVPWDGDRNGAITALCEKLQNQGKHPFMVPYGVSNGLGAVGYASCVAEIATQSDAQGITPKAIVHCTGSGATQAGLAIGAAMAMPDSRVIGIDIDAEPDRVRADVVGFATEAAAALNTEFSEETIRVVAGHAGPAYGVPHAATIDAIALVGRLEGLVLDPVYSGKGMAGLIHLVRQNTWPNDSDVIFVHTGGAPAVFAYGQSLGL